MCMAISAHSVAETLLNRFERAAEFFQHALSLAQVTQSSESAWATTYVNLGTCYRKLKYVAMTFITALIERY